MLIIIIELMLIFSFVKNIKNLGFYKIKYYLLIALVIQSIVLLLYRVELNSLGRVVYYSDAEVYWNQTLALLQGYKLSNVQEGYVQFCSLIQKTSPFYSVIWNNISNLLLLDLSILIFSYLALKNNINKRNVKYFFILTINNPLIYYGLFRNLKDSLFLFATTVIIYLFFIYSKKKKIYYLIVAFIINILITSVRPWGFLIFPMCFCGYYIYEFNHITNKAKKILLICSLIFIIPIIYIIMSQLGVLTHLQVWLPVLEQNASSQSILSLLMGPFVIILGPGWYRSLFGADYFMFYTQIGNACCFIGASIWWIELAYFISKFRIKHILSTSNIGIMTILILMFILLVYTMQYGGSLEIRFRSVVYTITSCAYLFTNNDFILKRIDYKIIPIFFIIFIVGTFMSV